VLGGYEEAIECYDKAFAHTEDYEKKKKIADNYKKLYAALLKKNPHGI